MCMGIYIWQIAQKRCEVCGGSGLVLTKENYMKCPGCGMFILYIHLLKFDIFSSQGARALKFVPL